MPRLKKDSDGIYQRPDSPCWWASWTDQIGRLVRRSTGIRIDQDPAQLRAKVVRAEWVLAASLPAVQHEQGRTFDDLMLAYLHQITPTKRAPDRDRYSAMNLYPFFTGRALADIRAADVRAYLASRAAAGDAPGTTNREIGLASSAWNWAITELEWPLTNPWKTRRLKEPAGRSRWLTEQEEEALVSAALAGKSEPLADFLTLGIYSGMRPGEMTGLAWARVDMEKRRVEFRPEDQKSGQRSIIPLNDRAMQALRSRRAWADAHCPGTPWVFCSRAGARILNFRKGFYMAVARAGLEDIHQHDLRRTFGSRLVQRGVDLFRVSELLRHADVRITQEVYAHLTDRNLADAAGALDATFHDDISRSPEGMPRLRLVR